MNRWLTGSLSLVFLIAGLAAQGSTGSTGSSKKTNRIDRRAEEMRENLGSVKQVKSHVRVQVRLKNGNRLKGVVKDGKLVERVNELRFVDADASDRGAGIRLWYSGGTRNYVFVPFVRLSEYKILERLSAKELVAIEHTLKMEESKRVEMRRQRLALQKQKRAAAAAKPGGETTPPAPGGSAGDGDPSAKSPAGTDDKPAKESAEQKQQKEWFTLLKDYPPQQGWNKAKRDEIKRRFAVIGTRPSEKEMRFVDRYDDWLQACKHFGMEPEQGSEAEPPGGKGRKRRKK